MELVLVFLLAMLGLGLYSRGAGRTEMIFAIAISAAVIGAIWLRSTAPPKAGSPHDPASAERPLKSREGGYLSSDACRSCHPAEYASWQKSYHRTMTQVVTPETMLADWDGTVLEIRGREYRLEQVDDRYWVDMIDPEYNPERRYDGRPIASGNTTERIRRRVVQSTGSHHQQIFWFSSGYGRELYLLPFTWLVSESRWIPYDASLMWRPEGRHLTEEWSRVCLPCHSTAGQPRRDSASKELDTHVGELGIACEACHGPAEEHAARYRNPLRRSWQYVTDTEGASIVNPANLDALASAQVCGQCHSHNTLKGRAENRRGATTGRSFRPGDDLNRTRVIHNRPEDNDFLSPFQRYSEDSISWPDGMVRTAGRDYHGILETPCFAGGEYNCLSCHSMHNYEDRDDQLKPGMRSNAACLQCHPEFETKASLEAHTHHADDSTGSLCYDCHMPHSSYALLKGVRSHTLNSPNLEESVEFGRPNACNLCHLDQTLAWTGEILERWYGQEASLPEEAGTSVRSAAVDWLLEGDAAQRGLIAWAMSKEEAQAASGSEWMAPLLGRVMNDPEYPAVSMIARKTLSSLPGFEDIAVTEPDAHARVLERWQSLPVQEEPGIRGYQRQPGELDTEAIDAAYSRRDRRHVNVAE